MRLRHNNKSHQDDVKEYSLPDGIHLIFSYITIFLIYCSSWAPTHDILDKYILDKSKLLNHIHPSIGDKNDKKYHENDSYNIYRAYMPGRN
ncbi:MAG TPA: hypothetical protein VNJ29_01550 [Candidatus Nitrosotenuis sp.]|jgi:hypothetical protein|nr:hypothetical protein [Candidatus Nitrosotenuis sp.]